MNNEKRLNRVPSGRWLLLLSTFLFAAGPVSKLAGADVDDQRQKLLQRGEQIYRESCAACHGDKAQGVADAYAEPLVGDDSAVELAKVINDTMPEGEPEKCTGTDASAVAEYLYENFYSEAAQIRNRPPRVSLARLTADQLRQSLADLYSQFEGLPTPTSDRGVKGIYFDGDRFKNDKKKIERVDPTIDFDFGRESPGEGISAESFYIYWEGGLRADVTGRYEIVIRSTCSFVFDFGKIGRNFIDNHVQSGDKTEFRKSVTLTAGRVYPFKIDFIQRKRKTELPPAKISLSWVPPNGVEEIIPARNFVPGGAPATYSLQTTLPADDRSYGFVRGVAINRQWDESTTAAALEFAQIAVDEMWPSYRRKHRRDSDENRSQLRGFLTTIVESAFRQPLDDELRRTYIDHQLEQTQDDAEAIKRVLLLSLKSPRFLYPGADATLTQSQRTANRVALILYDSLPTDDRLRKAAREGSMQTEEQVRNYVRERVNDYRVRAKTREFLYEWLNLSGVGEITKNAESFPGFDAKLVADLRDSLDAFLDEVVWNGSGDYRQFYQADWAFTTDRLAAFYGDSWKPAEEPAEKSVPTPLRKSVPDPAHRFGLLTHPYLMSTLSHFDSTSPVHRGVFLVRYMLGRNLRPPAEALAPLSPDLHPDLTTRQRVHLQTSPESCQVCHAKINGLGFTMENFDAVGRYREMERDQPIDAKGVYNPRVGDRVEFAGPGDLANYLVASEDAHRAFVRRAFQHFVKQPVAAYGPDTLDRLVEKFRDTNYNVRDLVVEIAVVASLE
jgi:mono/diheme cytochrome c family protein